MSILPIDELCQEDDFDRNPVGTYWTPPVPVSIHEVNPALRAAVLLAIESRSESLDQFEIHLAYAFDMESCAPTGTFLVSIDESNGRAIGIYNGAGDVGATEPMWFAFEQDIDLAFNALYDRARERGYLA